MSQLPDKTFQRRKEDFVCEQCGVRVEGNGYTNHCPMCLYSKHADVFPGDRKARCGGLMEPVSFEQKRVGYLITHRCLSCGYEKKNKTAENDNFEVLVGIAKTQNNI
jgi:rubrerythrin